MTIEVVVTDSGEVEITGSGYRPVGELLVGGEPIDDEALLEEVRAVLVGGSLANDASLREVDGEWTINGDPTEAAFLVAEAKLGLTAVREQRFERIGEVPFTSERKLMRSEEHTSELQSLMRISYAVFCLKKKKNNNRPIQRQTPNTNTPS